MLSLVADYDGSDDEEEKEDSEEENGGTVKLLVDGDVTETGTKRPAEAEAGDMQQHGSYGGGWYDARGNYCWITADGTLHLLRPDQSYVVTKGNTGAQKGEHLSGHINKRLKNSKVPLGKALLASRSGSEETFEFPQYQINLLNPQVVKQISIKSGARIRVKEGRLKTGSVKKGIQATALITGSEEAREKALELIQDKLEKNGADVMTEEKKYEFTRRSRFVDNALEKARVNPLHDWRHSGMGWDNGGLTGTDGATGAHCTWKKS